jgi:hypothetical protein
LESADEERPVPLASNAERLHARDRRLPTHLYDLELSHDGIPLGSLVQPQDAIGHREDRVVLLLRVLVVPDQKRRGLPGCHLEGESLHEGLQRQFPIALRALSQAHH